MDACQQKNIPIRIGVNGGSLEKHILAKYGAPTPEAMVESALYHVRLLEKFDFNNIVISIKNSNVPRMMEAYRQLSAVTDYPLHVGVTEAGTYQMGLLKSGMGIGGMLLEGIGSQGEAPEEAEAPGVGALTLLVQGVATSIDALSVGFTIADYTPLAAFVCSLIIALVTFVICVAGFVIGKTVGNRLSGKAEILGGAILIFIGLKIFLSGVVL